jgi:colanic acid/amylovoran biosynthesis protein
VGFLPRSSLFLRAGTAPGIAPLSSRLAQVIDVPPASPRLCLAGAAPTTRNLGVEALLHSAAAGLAKRFPEAHLTVFDFGQGTGEIDLDLASGPLRVTRVAASNSRRFWTPECMATQRLMGRMGPLGNQLPAVRALRRADALFDVSGGDSFTDLYGSKRFWTTTHPKFLALEQGARLVLLPQTYGPFASPKLRAIAADAVGEARAAWARDQRSFDALRDLLGDKFDPERHRLGVDMAFGLVPKPPGRSLSAELDRWLAASDGPIVGINVSGLIYKDPAAAAARYGFKADYAKLVLGLVQALVEDGAKVVLVPHVLAPHGAPESDPEACVQVAAEIPSSIKASVCVLEAPYSAAEVKHVLHRLDWFCGTRMHSTIGALSGCVPTAAIAYSLKFQGVFDGLDVGDSVIDPRELDTREALEALMQAFRTREEDRESLADTVPRTKLQVEEQMDALAAAASAPTD